MDLEEFLRRRGEKLLRSGREFRLERRHRITVRGSEWYDHAARQGGHAVSFVQHYYGTTYQEAMELLLGNELGEAYPAAQPKREEPPKPFALPPSHTDMRRVYAYLMKQRHISREVITHFARAGLLYEDAQYHNCVFVGTDEQGVPRHAHKRSTNSPVSYTHLDVYKRQEHRKPILWGSFPPFGQWWSCLRPLSCSLCSF